MLIERENTITTLTTVFLDFPQVLIPLFGDINIRTRVMRPKGVVLKYILNEFSDTCYLVLK